MQAVAAQSEPDIDELAVAQARESDNQGWRAWLKLAFENGRNKTVLRREHFGPLMIQRPFYPEGRVCHAYVLHPPGGVVGGDRLKVGVSCDDAASGLITTPGANRFYGSDGRRAEQIQTLDIGNGSFEWLPAETIYFDQASVSQRLVIELTGRSRFIGWDISCFGRAAGGYFFNEGDVTNRLQLFRDKCPVVVDRLHVTGRRDLSRLSGMRGATVFGTMILAAPDCIDNDMLELVRHNLPGKQLFAATLIDGIITVRYLGSNVEAARDGFVRIWCAVRPAVMSGLQAKQPRIWAT